MSDAADTKEVDALISAYLDNDLDDAGHQTLDAWLTADRANQQRFLTAVMDHRALAQQMQADQHPTVRRLRVRPESRRLWTSRILAAAAVLMLALGGVLWVKADPPGPRLIVFDASGESTGPRVVRGDHIGVKPDRGGGLLYDDGTRLQLLGGSEVIVEGSSSGKQVMLVTGQLTATVAHQPSGKPFIITTSTATTTVVGTTLTVVTDGSETEVAVAQGKVAVERTSDKIKIEVAAGERSTVAADVPLRARADSVPAGQLYRVGPGQPFATIADLPKLAPGDVVELQPGVHRGAWRLPAGGTAMRPITVRGAPGEPPLIDSEGLTLTGAGAVPRASLQLLGGYWRVEHLAFTNARNGLNAAAIRLAEVQSAVILDCRITRSDQGVDAVADEVTITNCDVGFCGTTSNDGYGHDVNLLATRALVRGCHLHDQLHGQALRSTCAHLDVEANRIVNAEDGEISIATGDRPTEVTLAGNLVVSKRERKGNTMRFILTEGEGGGTLRLVHNTFVADSQWVTFIAPGKLAVNAYANIFSGSDRIALPGNVVGGSNWLPATATAPPGFAGTDTGSDPGFVAPATGDYRLRPDSPCVGKTSPSIIERWPDPMRGQNQAKWRLTLEPSPTAQAGVRPRAHPWDIGAFVAAP